MIITPIVKKAINGLHRFWIAFSILWFILVMWAAFDDMTYQIDYDFIQRNSVIQKAIGPIFVYVLGWTTVWIIRGFHNEQD